MSTIREMLVKLGVTTDAKKVAEFDKALEGVKKGMERALQMSAKLTLGIAALATGSTIAADSLARDAVDIERQARALGVTAERYQELSQTFKRFDLDANDVADALNTLADRSKDLTTGNKSMADDFGLIGLKAKDLKGLKPDEIFVKFADAVSKSKDVTARNTAVVRALGDDLGRKLLPALLDGQKGLDGYAKSARDAGLIMSGPALRSAVLYAEQTSKLRAQANGLKNEFLLALMPTLAKGAKASADFIEANRPWISGKIKAGVEGGERALGKVRDILKTIGGGSVMGGLERAAKFVAAGFATMFAMKGATAIMAFVQLLHATLGMIGVAGAIAAAKIAAVVAVVSVLFLIFEDGLTYLRGGDSLLGRWIERAKEAGGSVGRVAKILEMMGVIARQIFGMIAAYWRTVFGAMWSVARPVLELLWRLFAATWEKVAKPVIDLFLDLFLGMLNLASIGLTGFTTWFGDEFKKLLDFARPVTDGIEKLFSAVFKFIEDEFNKVLDQTGEFIEKIRDLPGIRSIIALGEDDEEETPQPVLARATANAIGNSAARGAQAGAVTVGPTTINVTQQPGESGEQLATRINEQRRADDARKARLMRSRAGVER